MPESTLSGDLATAVSSALRGDRSPMRAVFADLRQRAEEHAVDRFSQRVDALLAPPPAKGQTCEPCAAIDELKRSVDDLTQKVAALQQQADQSLLGLLQGFSGLQQQVRTAQNQSRAFAATSGTAKTLARQQETLAAMRLTDQIQNLTNTVNNAQFAAFGQRGSVLATNNVLLAGNQLLWTFIDPLMRTLGLTRGVSPSLLGILAPLGSLLTGQAVLGGRQHVRFISDVAEFRDRQRGDVVVESLRTHVASSFFTGLQRRTDVPVTVVALDAPNLVTLAALVRNGLLQITIDFDPDDSPNIPQTVRVAWIIDLGADIG